MSSTICLLHVSLHENHCRLNSTCILHVCLWLYLCFDIISHEEGYCVPKPQYPRAPCAFEFELIVCVGCYNCVLVKNNCMIVFMSAVDICVCVFMDSYYWQWGLSGVSAVSFAISEWECRVYFRGCRGNHCICSGSDWFCRARKNLLFLSCVNTWHTCTHT